MDFIAGKPLLSFLRPIPFGQPKRMRFVYLCLFKAVEQPINGTRDKFNHTSSH